MFWRKQKATMHIEMLRTHAKRNLSHQDYQFEIEKNRKFTFKDGVPDQFENNIQSLTDKTRKKKPSTSLTSSSRRQQHPDEEAYPGGSNEYELVFGGEKGGCSSINLEDVDRVPVHQFKAWLLGVPDTILDTKVSFILYLKLELRQ
jgi:hypothetical protein